MHTLASVCAAKIPKHTHTSNHCTYSVDIWPHARRIMVRTVERIASALRNADAARCYQNARSDDKRLCAPFSPPLPRSPPKPPVYI